MSDFEYSCIDCESCLCTECKENVSNCGKCINCINCNGKLKKTCPINKYRDDYGDGQGK